MNIYQDKGLFTYNDGSANEASKLEMLKILGYEASEHFSWFSWIEYGSPVTNITPFAMNILLPEAQTVFIAADCDLGSFKLKVSNKDQFTKPFLASDAKQALNEAFYLADKYEQDLLKFSSEDVLNLKNREAYRKRLKELADLYHDGDTLKVKTQFFTFINGANYAVFLEG